MFLLQLLLRHLVISYLLLLIFQLDLELGYFSCLFPNPHILLLETVQLLQLQPKMGKMEQNGQLGVADYQLNFEIMTHWDMPNPVEW